MKTAIGNGRDTLETRADKQGGTDREIQTIMVGLSNAGKSELFERLTGEYSRPGNWSGTTNVDSDWRRMPNSRAVVMDTPGLDWGHIPSALACQWCQNLPNHGTALLVNAHDALSLDRSLYLTTQLLELNLPIMVVINMIDLLPSAGISIDYCSLEHILGVPVLPVSARNNVGIEKLKKMIDNFNSVPSKTLRYSSDIESKLSAIQKILDLNGCQYNRFMLTKVLEGDLSVIKSFNLNLNDLRKIDKIRGTDINYEEKINEERHKICEDIYKKVVKRTHPDNYVKLTRKIDQILTGRYTAFPVFFLIMFAIFYVSFGPIGTVCHDFTKNMISRGIEYPVNFLINQLHFNEIFSSFTMAVIGGLSDVISFLPQILLLLGSIGILEDTGYLARAAFIMDKIMRHIGLSGKAFVPLLMGFGCSVPAILSARILRTEQERKLTIYLIPFMSCGAKIPVYLMFLNAFFPKYKSLMMFSIYLLGILVSVLFSFVFRKMNKIEENPILLEMPNYKMPSLRNSYLRLWEHCKDFLERVGVIILGSSIVIWFMQSFDFSFNFIEDSSKSILASLGNLIAPIFSWSGFGNWKAAVALITGLLSKEAIISTMSVVYRSDNISLNEALLANFSRSSALAMIVFILLYPPCVSAFATFRKEAGLSSACISFVINSLIALVFSILTFGVSNLLFSM